MWDEYAESIGTTANNLTQAQKIQAEYNGIMKETKFQTGDAATYANTFAGRVSQLKTAFLNLKTAVGKVVAPIASVFIPVIVTAMNAVTKFFNKIQQLLSVFGFKWQDVVTKNSGSIAGMGDSASGTADKIGSIGDSAEKTAKKMKRALGGMDELNVLNFNKDSGSSSGSSGTDGMDSIGGSGVGSMFDNTITEDPISPQIKKIADKIKEYLEPLKKIKFDNLIKSFDKLKKSLQPFKKKLFEGLDWLWNEFLVPIAEWTVEEAAPAFLEAISGALDGLNGVMDYAKPYLQYLWDEFLKPIGEWTGGVIVSVLNGIGNGLSVIGKWLSDNAPTIEKVKKDLDPIVKLLKECGKFLGNILGLAWQGFSTVLQGLWKYALKPIWDYVLYPILTNFWSKISGLASILGGIFEAFNKLMAGDWKGAGKAIFDGLVEGMKTIWEGSFVKKYLYDPIVGGFKKLFGIHSPSTVFIQLGTDMLNGLKKPFEGIITWVTNVKNNIVNGFGGLWTKGKEIGTNLLNGIGNAFSNAWSFAKTIGQNIVNGIGSGLSSLGSGITNIFKGAMNGAIGVVESALNWIIDKMNMLSWKIPDWVPKIGGNKFGFNFKRVSIPRLAEGGWVAANNPQLALIGDNKREGEIVTPESKIYDQVSKAIQDNGGTGTQQLEITIYHKYEDGRTVIQKINQAQIDAGEVLLLT